MFQGYLHYNFKNKKSNLIMKKYSIILSIIFSFCFVSTFAQHKNILISTSNSPNEPSIVLNPKDPSKVIAASNINNLYYSSDTGRTWTEQTLSSTYGVWGDPALFVDTLGDFYFFHLSNPGNLGSWIDRIVCQKSFDNGINWTDGTFTGLNGSKAQDKHWVAINRKTNVIYVTWTQFDDYGSTLPADSSVILFSKSSDLGMTWTAAKRINQIAGDCIDEDNTVEGATPAIGPNGELYVSWAGPAGLRFDRSLDDGNTWLTNDILIDPMPTGWDYSIPGINRANGLPITVCDLSNGPNHGTIYVNWSDQRNGSTDTDIWLSKSQDGGNTWSAPMRVNNDAPGKQQFFTWMTIDQTNGNLYFVFYDRRNYANNRTDVYMAQSKDGGQSFINFKISELSFIPNSGVFFGDYTNVTANNNIVRPIWTALFGSDLKIYTALINVDSISQTVGINQNLIEANSFYPNPSSEENYISFKIHEPSKVSVEIFDMAGKSIAKLFDQKEYTLGKYIEKIEPKKLGLKPGNYTYQLKINNQLTRQKVLIIN